MSTAPVPQPIAVCRCAIETGSKCICAPRNCWCVGPCCESKTLEQNANYIHAREQYGEEFANQMAPRMGGDAIGKSLNKSMGAGPAGPPPPKPPPPPPSGPKTTRRRRCCKSPDEGKPESSGPNASRRSRGPEPEQTNPAGSLPAYSF
ncbi:hypothetical protein TWF481_011890 [Arthrobotrys musiformis]|uniref:Uncharacterized protein n=1 Tax=Arthrobotrys musiformis TaxID=47236 RepID=A0AAV9VXJ2_9PEZI